MKGDRMNKNTAIGVAIIVLVWIVGNEVITFLELPISPTTQSVVVSLLGTGLGAFIAKRNFLLPAFAVWFLCWSLALYLLYLVAEPTGQASITGIARYNAIAIGLSAIATLIGVLVGQRLAQRSQRIVVAP